MTDSSMINHEQPGPRRIYHSNSEHLGALLGWLHRLLAWQIGLTRHTYGALADDEYRGLYIPDAEVDLLCTAMLAVPEEFQRGRAQLAAERQRIAARAQASAEAGVVLALPRLARAFGLSPFAEDVLLLALAPELELRYERIYAYIQDDVTKKRPTVDLALRLLCSTPQDWHAARGDLAPPAPLLAQRLLVLFEDGQRHAPLPAQFLKLDARIAAALLDQEAIDPAISTLVVLTPAQRTPRELVLPSDLLAQLRRAVAGQPGLTLALQGGYGSGRRALAAALCGEVGQPLLTVDLAGAAAASGPGAAPPQETLLRVLREARLQGAALLWCGADALLASEADGPWRPALLAALDAWEGLAFLALAAPWEARGALRHTRFLRVELPEPGFREREQLWRQRLNGDSPGDEAIGALASTFRLSAGQVRDAVAMARTLAGWRGAPLGTAELYAACRAQSSGRLDSLAHKIKATYRWGDIVLPPDQLEMLREVSVQIRHRRTVLERWGFDRHLAMGKGINVLFAGPSGTGKTMAAEIIASDLGLELYKVDLSSMVSKYIGETEKNLERIFTAAREANAILFFDEADSIFGKRSEVKDAHDRYANIEVGYLLQKMEEYDGVVILATNLRKNMDDAFIRRLHVAIDFPFPEEPDRLRIWQKVFPAEAPLSQDLDLAFLARQFKLAGGNIRNIALLAAYLAAEDSGQIGMAHAVRAIKREYQKLGKLVTASEFGPYLSVVRS